MSITAPVPTAPDAVVVLRDVEWETYERLRSSPANRGISMTYDRGVMYLMSPSKLHERISEIIGQLIVVWTEERQIPRQSAGSTTMKSELLGRGLEPDKCYYFQHEGLVRGRDEYDTHEDPPPDLAVEVDVTSLSTARMPIYAALGVPEVWRWSEHNLEAYLLTGSEYVKVSDSGCLPGFPFDLALKILQQRHEQDETSLLRFFRQMLSA